MWHEHRRFKTQHNKQEEETNNQTGGEKKWAQIRYSWHRPSTTYGCFFPPPPSFEACMMMLKAVWRDEITYYLCCARESVWFVSVGMMEKNCGIGIECGKGWGEEGWSTLFLSPATIFFLQKRSTYVQISFCEHFATAYSLSCCEDIIPISFSIRPDLSTYCVD